MENKANGKISVEKCQLILNVGKRKYSDEEVLKIRDFLYSMAEIEFQQFQNERMILSIFKS